MPTTNKKTNTIVKMMGDMGLAFFLILALPLTLMIVGVLALFSIFVPFWVGVLLYVIVVIIVSAMLGWTTEEYALQKHLAKARQKEASQAVARTQEDSHTQDTEARKSPPAVRTSLPIIGPPAFCASVERMLDELRNHAPSRYREVLEYLPKAEYDASLSGHSYSDGRFGIDGSDYESFRYVFLHEVGHNLQGRKYNDWSEDAAHAYASQVLAEIG